MGVPVLLGGGSFEIDGHSDIFSAINKTKAQSDQSIALTIAAGIATDLRSKGYRALSPTRSNRVDAGLQCVFGEDRYVDVGIVLEEVAGNVSKFIVVPFGFRRRNDRALYDKLAEDWKILAPIVDRVVTDDFGAAPIKWLTPKEVDARCAVPPPRR